MKIAFKTLKKKHIKETCLLRSLDQLGFHLDFNKEIKLCEMDTNIL